MAVADSKFPAALVALRHADQARPKQADIRFAIAQILNQTQQLAGRREHRPSDREGHAELILSSTISSVGEYMRRNEPAKAEKIMSERVANNPKIVEYRLYQAAFFYWQPTARTRPTKSWPT